MGPMLALWTLLSGTLVIFTSGVYCDLPPTVPHGEYVYVEEDDVLQRSTVRLQCHRGFIATFEETLICTRDGWTEHNGYCQSAYTQHINQDSFCMKKTNCKRMWFLSQYPDTYTVYLDKNLTVLCCDFVCVKFTHTLQDHLTVTGANKTTIEIIVAWFTWIN